MVYPEDEHANLVFVARGADGEFGSRMEVILEVGEHPAADLLVQPREVGEEGACWCGI